MVSEEVHDQGRDPTCFAHACATVITCAEQEIIGRVPQDHDRFVESMVRRWPQGAAVEDVLRELCPQHCLRFRQIPIESVDVCLEDLRPVLASFHLQDCQWAKWSEFFKIHEPRSVMPREVLRKVSERLSEAAVRALDKPEVGHAIVLLGPGEAGETYWKFKNSWGAHWMDEGCGRIAKDVLHESSNLKFFVVFHDVQDLSSDDHRRLKLACQPAFIRVDKPAHYVSALGTYHLPAWLLSGQSFPISFFFPSGGSKLAYPMHPVAIGSTKRTHCAKIEDSTLFLAVKTCRDEAMLQRDMEASGKATKYAAEFAALHAERPTAARGPAWLQNTSYTVTPTQAHCTAKIRFSHTLLATLTIGGTMQRVLVEPWLDGTYQRFQTPSSTSVSRNVGCEPELEAFVRFCADASGGHERMLDLQGVKFDDGSFILSDPRFELLHTGEHPSNLSTSSRCRPVPDQFAFNFRSGGTRVKCITWRADDGHPALSLAMGDDPLVCLDGHYVCRLSEAYDAPFLGARSR